MDGEQVGLSVRNMDDLVVGKLNHNAGNHNADQNEKDGKNKDAASGEISEHIPQQKGIPSTKE